MNCLELVVCIDLLEPSKTTNGQVGVGVEVVVVGRVRCYEVSVVAGHSRSQMNCSVPDRWN